VAGIQIKFTYLNINFIVEPQLVANSERFHLVFAFNNMEGCGMSFGRLRLKVASSAVLIVVAAIVVAACTSSGPPPGHAVSVHPPIGAYSASAPAALHQAPIGLNDPQMKEVALELVSSAENSTLDWRSQYGYIQDIGDGRGYTAGIMGYCSGTGDMLEVVEYYTQLRPGNVLAQYLPRLKYLANVFAKNGYEPSAASASLQDLEPHFVADWELAAKDPQFQRAQDWERDRVYFNPAVNLAKQDGLHDLGQFIYFDTAVNVGEVSSDDFQALRAESIKLAKTPAQGGDEANYLEAFLRVRLQAMKGGDYGPTDRVTSEQLKFLEAGNLNLQVPLYWSTYGDQYSITTLPKAP
jgi:chitosanase